MMVMIVVMIAVMVRDLDVQAAGQHIIGATQVYVALYGVFDNIIWRYDGVIDDRMVWRRHGKMTGLYDQMLV